MAAVKGKDGKVMITPHCPSCKQEMVQIHRNIVPADAGWAMLVFMHGDLKCLAAFAAQLMPVEILPPDQQDHVKQIAAQKSQQPAPGSREIERSAGQWPGLKKRT